MNFEKTKRILRSLGLPEGRKRYSQKVRSELWAAAARLPWAMRYNATLSGTLRIRLNTRDR